MGTEAINLKIIVDNSSQLQLQTFLQTNQHLFRLFRKAVRLACFRADSYVHFLDVITPNNPQYSTDGPWSAWAGAWGAGSLVYGVDYTQSITLNGSTFPNGTLISWSFPLTGGPFGVWSYPCIVYGSTPELINPTVPSTQVANFANLSTSYSSTYGQSGNFDTIFDMWLTSQPNGGHRAI